MEKLYKVEFIDNEPYCRFDDKLGDPQWMIDRCGIDDEVYHSESIITTSEVAYVRPGTKLLDLIQCFGSITTRYDRFRSTAKLENFIEINPSMISDIIVKGYNQFRKDYPKFNLKEYTRINDSLDAYYDNMQREQREEINRRTSQSITG